MTYYDNEASPNNNHYWIKKNLKQYKRYGIQLTGMILKGSQDEETMDMMHERKKGSKK